MIQQQVRKEKAQKLLFFIQLRTHENLLCISGKLKDFRNEREVWVTLKDNQVAGYVTLKWHSAYPVFQAQHIPEINDLNVLPEYRNHGIGSLLLDTAEQTAKQRSSVVGLGVGLYADYGSAQRMYVKRGYIPDGAGITYNHIYVIPGQMVRMDDDLILWMIKKLA